MSTIHPTAVIHPKAQIGTDCQIGPFCVLGEHVVLGDRCQLHSHVVIDGHTRLGNDNTAFPFASLGLKTQDLKWRGGTTHTVIGNGNVFREGTTVHSGTKDGEATVIGNNNLFLIHAHVAHDCQLGNNIIMSGFAGLAGHVIVHDHAILSGYAAVHQFCRVGKFCIIGGAAKVTQDAPPFMLLDGNPAETKTINKVGLERNGFSAEAISALRQAYKIIFREGLTLDNAVARMETELPPLPEVKHLIEFVRTSERGLCR